MTGTILAVSEPMENIHGKRILLVDEDSEARAAIAPMLQALKAEVVQAGDGIEALSLCARRSFDIVLTDYDLPGMTGDELAGDVRSFDPNQRVILITGQAHQLQVIKRKAPCSDSSTRSCSSPAF
jgi:CheY-like chemotaxis protein